MRKSSFSSMLMTSMTSYGGIPWLMRSQPNLTGNGVVLLLKVRTQCGGFKLRMKSTFYALPLQLKKSRIHPDNKWRAMDPHVPRLNFSGSAKKSALQVKSCIFNWRRWKSLRMSPFDSFMRSVRRSRVVHDACP